MIRRWVAAICLVAGALGAAGAQPSARAVAKVPLPGADTVLDARAKRIASRLRCPVCQGESIQDSPAELATQMKALVREKLYAGESDAQVLDYFTQKYGQWILLEPKAEGLNLLVYWLPVVFLLSGAVGVVVMVKRWTRPREALVVREVAPATDQLGA